MPNSTSPAPAQGRAAAARTRGHSRNRCRRRSASPDRASAPARRSTRAPPLPRRRISISVARCWLSAAEPPLPQNMHLAAGRRQRLAGVDHPDHRDQPVPSRSAASASADLSIIAVKRVASVIRRSNSRFRIGTFYRAGKPIATALLCDPTAIDRQRRAGDGLRHVASTGNTASAADLLGRREFAPSAAFRPGTLGSPSRPSMPSCCARDPRAASRTSGVSTQPGQIALTVMPALASSIAATLVMPSTPCLAAT